MSDGYCEFLIVGSGAGGATLAMELARRGRSVRVLETGRYQRRLGSLFRALGFFDTTWPPIFPRRSKEGVILWRTFMAGGTTVVSCGNGVRCLESELRELGIDIAEELAETEEELGVTPLDEALLSSGSRALRDAATAHRRTMEPMPKFIDSARCARCAQCVLGCRPGVKWTALDYLEKARADGAETVFNATVREVVTKHGRAQGVLYRCRDGLVHSRAANVIVAAGGLGTPPILQRSGIDDAGEGLFADLFVNVYGKAPGLSQHREPVMPLVEASSHDEGYILSPFLNKGRFVRFTEAGLRGALLPTRSTLGLMVKTSDDPAGRVWKEGAVSKPVTEADRGRLDRGVAAAREVLVTAGAREDGIVVTDVQGAHPGGTAAVGRIVDADLKTEIEGLYVCDASVLPRSPGLPPILTIVALAKRLAARLAA